ncbi:TPA: hypothetical protein ACGTLD_004604, partial [Salmonella enterica]
KNMIAFSGSHFRLPLLLRVSDKRVEPLPESEYSAPLRFQLADFAPRDNFVWVDRCYKMAQLWAPALAVKRNTMDNGATVLDILGGDNFIGLGRSSLSGQSLSEVFLNVKEKVLAMKPDIIRLWNFPKEIKDFTVDRD